MTTSYNNQSKSSSSFTTGTKHSASFSNGTKHSSSFSNAAKATTTFKKYLRHGKEPLVGAPGVLGDDFTFEDAAYMDGTLLQDVSFDQLTDQAWSNQTKN